MKAAVAVLRIDRRNLQRIFAGLGVRSGQSGRKADLYRLDQQVTQYVGSPLRGVQSNLDVLTTPGIADEPEARAALRVPGGHHPQQRGERTVDDMV